MMPKLSVGVVVAALLLSGCGGAVVTGETRHETKSVDLDKSESARVELRMGAGQMHVRGGTPKLVEADFTYNVDAWKPQVDYRAGVPQSELVIAQPENSGSSFGRVEYTWDLKLNERLPMDVVAHLGAGEANLELGRMSLRSVEVHMGAGQLTMDLRGEPARDYSVQIHGGVGQATVQLPKDVGIAATATGGLGGISTSGLEKRDGVWINPDRVNAPVTVRLDVKGGVGEIRLVR